MKDRYGIDELYKFCIILYFILIIGNFIFNSFIITILELILLIIILYRSLSKNIYRRRIENNKYLDIKNSITRKIERYKKIIRDRNTHMYKKCPKCSTTLRLPLKKGRHIVKCPKCSNRFEVKCRRGEKVKVEVIKNRS
jgi:uncharacterized C2H2 Zn-finger protein